MLEGMSWQTGSWLSSFLSGARKIQLSIVRKRGGRCYSCLLRVRSGPFGFRRSESLSKEVESLAAALSVIVTLSDSMGTRLPVVEVFYFNEDDLS